MKIINARVYSPVGFTQRSISFEGGIFTPGGGEELDAQGCYIIPGLVDIHLHGCASRDFCDASEGSVHDIARTLALNGTTAYCAALMTAGEEKLAQCLCALSGCCRGRDEARLLGAYLEGPFLSCERGGAHDSRFMLPPDEQLVRRLDEKCGGLIKIITVAPELKNAVEFTKALSDKYIITAGHTCASYEQSKDFFDSGAQGVTHLFNAMPPLHHREPGVIGALLDEHRVMAEIISDGVHVCDTVLRAAFSLLGEDRLILVSDSSPAAGMPDGLYTLGGEEVEKRGSTVARGGMLAGSASFLLDCVRHACSAGIPLVSAVKCASENPARLLGINAGSLADGCPADFLILDEALRLRAVYIGGERIT